MRQEYTEPTQWHCNLLRKVKPFRIENLLAATRYKVRITAVNSAGDIQVQIRVKKWKQFSAILLSESSQILFCFRFFSKKLTWFLAFTNDVQIAILKQILVGNFFLWNFIFLSPIWINKLLFSRIAFKKNLVHCYSLRIKKGSVAV